MFEQITINSEDKQKLNKTQSFLENHYKGYSDPWGFEVKTCIKALKRFYPFYKKYFKVRAFGLENIEDEQYIFVSNHTGQVPIDGVLITIALATEHERPRLVRGMIERFMTKIPFLGSKTAEAGSVLGDRENCEYLLDKKESILVFPEGARGISKNTNHFYELQPFSSGFYRIALKKKVKIVPVAVIGAEEMFPFVFHPRKLARKLGLPGLPITPFGLLGLFPLPSPIDIHFGKPIELPELSTHCPGDELAPYLYQVENEVKDLIKNGLKQRRPFIDEVRNPITNFFRKFQNKKKDK